MFLKILRGLEGIVVFSSLVIDIIHSNEDFYLSNDECIHSSESYKVLVTLKVPSSPPAWGRVFQPVGYHNTSEGMYTWQ